MQLQSIYKGLNPASPRAHKNVNGIPYASPLNFTHSSDVRTMQEIFHAGPFLGDATNAEDLSDLFDPGAIPKKRNRLVWMAARFIRYSTGAEIESN